MLNELTIPEARYFKKLRERNDMHRKKYREANAIIQKEIVHE